MHSINCYKRCAHIPGTPRGCTLPWTHQCSPLHSLSVIGPRSVLEFPPALLRVVTTATPLLTEDYTGPQGIRVAPVEARALSKRRR